MGGIYFAYSRIGFIYTIFFVIYLQYQNFVYSFASEKQNNSLKTIKIYTTMTKKFICTVCGYVHEGETAPERCPQCKVPATKFKEVDESAGLAFETEHELGVAKGCDEEMIKDLNAHFMGECTEVGMYLAMSRQADREGYPEIAEAFKRYAWEEAEHAAKFAELLGSTLEPNMTASTKKNLAWRVDCEFGATQGKFDLAACCKKNNLDALHDTIHEMAKDEARHGKALKGLLDRHFK